MLFNYCCINSVCLIFIILLFLQIVFKLHLKDSIKLKLSSVLGININNNLEYYINKIVTYNKKIINIYICLLIIIISFGLSFSIFLSHELFNNLDNYIALHNNTIKW